MTSSNNSITLNIVDWGDEAYKKNKGPRTIASVTLPEGFKGFSYDGGRLDFVGHSETIFVSSHQFSIALPNEETSDGS